jgi:diguanylate cyclase (GGDEF)-like protein
MDDEVASRLGRLQAGSFVLMALYDEHDRLRYANQAFRSAFALTSDEMPFWADIMRRNTSAGKGTIIRVADFESWLVSAQSRRGKMPFRAFETDLVDGRWLWMTETVQSDGWMLCIATDITSIRTTQRSLRQDRDLAIRAAQTDELTGIANRRFMMAALEALIVSQKTAELAIGCMCIIDLDLFKRINDRFGHQTGDDVLVDFARRVHPMVRRRDSFGRVGGEEFMLVLPDTTLEEGELIVNRLLSMIRHSRPIAAMPGFSYTCSAGVADTRSSDTASGVYKRADEALYLAKQDGRDRLKIAA